MVTPTIRVRGGNREGPDGILFELSGGRLCLDFTNTVDNRPTDHVQDRLATYADLASWSRQAGVLSPAEEQRLLHREKRRPDEARAALARATALRETLFRLFFDIAEGRMEAAHIESLQPELAAAFRAPLLRPYELVWKDDLARLDGMLGPIVRSAVELLTSPERDRVRVCAAGNCDWLFLDASRNRSRQWCDMAVCGNRSKVNRYHRRRRSRRRRQRTNGGGRR